MDISLHFKVCFTILLFAFIFHIMFQLIYKEFKQKWAVIPSAISITIVNLILIELILSLIWGWL
jgi:predicted tellurium resistance membrane protein TerC